MSAERLMIGCGKQIPLGDWMRKHYLLANDSLKSGSTSRFCRKRKISFPKNIITTIHSDSVMPLLKDVCESASASFSIEGLAVTYFRKEMA
jgi:hypothetical protein